MRTGRLFLAALALAACPGVYAQSDFPRKPIKLIAPFAAGATSDAMARMMAKEMTAILGQQVVVENITGAGGIIGLTAVARAAPDGYTIGMGGVGSLIHTAAVYAKQIKFDVRKDLAPLGLLGTAPVVAGAAASAGIADLKALAAMARDKKGDLPYGSAGVGGALHLGAELFQREAGVTMRHVPYRGGAPALADLRGGQVPVAFLDVTTLLPHKDAPQIKLLAAASEQRVPHMPNVPTFREQGYNVVVEVWLGLVAPAKLPPEVYQKLVAATTEAASKPSFLQAIDTFGLRPLPHGREAMAKLMQEEYDLWVPLITKAGVTAE